MPLARGGAGRRCARSRRSAASQERQRSGTSRVSARMPGWRSAPGGDARRARSRTDVRVVPRCPALVRTAATAITRSDRAFARARAVRCVSARACATAAPRRRADRAFEPRRSRGRAAAGAPRGSAARGWDTSHAGARCPGARSGRVAARSAPRRRRAGVGRPNRPARGRVQARPPRGQSSAPRSAPSPCGRVIPSRSVVPDSDVERRLKAEYAALARWPCSWWLCGRLAGWRSRRARLVPGGVAASSARTGRPARRAGRPADHERRRVIGRAHHAGGTSMSVPAGASTSPPSTGLDERVGAGADQRDRRLGHAGEQRDRGLGHVSSDSEPGDRAGAGAQRLPVCDGGHAAACMGQFDGDAGSPGRRRSGRPATPHAKDRSDRCGPPASALPLLGQVAGAGRGQAGPQPVTAARHRVARVDDRDIRGSHPAPQFDRRRPRRRRCWACPRRHHIPARAEGAAASIPHSLRPRWWSWASGRACRVRAGFVTS